MNINRINVRMVPLSQLIDILIEMEHEGANYINLKCELTKNKDHVRVERYEGVGQDDEPTHPGQPLVPPGLTEEEITEETTLTEDILEQLINKSYGCASKERITNRV